VSWLALNKRSFRVATLAGIPAVSVRGKVGPLRRRWADLWTIPDPVDRLEFVRKVAFPPVSCMRWNYPHKPGALRDSSDRAQNIISTARGSMFELPEHGV